MRSCSLRSDGRDGVDGAMSIPRSRRPIRGGILPRSSKIGESELERDHRTIAKAAGWFVDKVIRTALNSFPDRFYARAKPEDTCPHCGRGRVVLMEWKAPGEKPSPQQLVRHRQLREAGVEVYVVDNVRDANRILWIFK